MKQRFILMVLSAALMTACASSGGGNGKGYVRSVPQVFPADNVFQVNIQRINGKQPMKAQNYSVPAGEATIRVSVIPDRRWAPDLVSANAVISSKEFTFTVEDSVTYEIGGKIDTEAYRSEQQTGNFWEPVIYREF